MGPWDYTGSSFDIVTGAYSKIRLVFPVLSVMSMCNNTSRTKEKKLHLSKTMERGNGVRESKRDEELGRKIRLEQ